jgi:2-iminobutanoate/2-iminopropanoate deaminase
MTTPVGPYSPVLRAGQWLVCSGQVGLRDGALAEGGVSEETRQALANVRALLESSGASLGQVVKTTVFLTDMAHYTVVNEAYVEAFGQHRPARTLVEVSALPLGASIEIEAWAHLSFAPR